jgi:PAS domain S-box-containing protein
MLQKPIEDQNLFFLATEMSIDGIIVGNTQGKISHINHAILKMWGSTDKNEIIGKYVFEFIVPTEIERAAEKSINGFRTGKGWTDTFTVVNKTGKKIPIELTCTPISDSEGTPIGFIDIVRDITERVKSEEKLQEAQKSLTISNEKLLVVGGLVRHDISNKLTTVNSSIYMAKKSGKTEHLTQAEQACHEIKRMLKFSRDYELFHQQKSNYINVGDAFREVLELFPNINTLKTINECQKIEVYADSLLKELFYNLIDNTLKYGKKTTQITITYTAQPDELTLIYQDDGEGIAPEMKQKLFKKGAGYGTGLGLYLTKKTLDAYGWQIKETGKHMQDAKFEITIPKTNQKEPNYKITS